jgi:hypothetical protein
MANTYHMYRIRLHFTPSDDTNEALSQLIFAMNRESKRSTINNTYIEFMYDYTGSFCSIGCINNHSSTQVEPNLRWVLTSEPARRDGSNGVRVGDARIEDSMIRFLNLPIGSIWPNDGTHYRAHPSPLSTTFLTAWSYMFNNVWDRNTLYIHASFVNYTPYQYLGQNGEFYPKPSKIYEFHDSSKDFEIWYTFDGLHPVSLPYEDVEVELCFILDNRKYISE